MRRLAFIGILLFGSVTLGQTVTSRGPAATTRGRPSAPATRGTATRPPAAATARGPAGRAASMPKDLETVLGDPLTIDAENMPFGRLTDQLRLTQTNLAVNWNAFAKAGVTKETPITLHLKDLSYEQVVRTLMEVVPATGTRANYTVEENALEITTNTELSVDNASQLYDLGKVFAYSFNPAPQVEEVMQNGMLVMAVIQTELARAGDPVDTRGHNLDVRESMLHATVSQRGQVFINRAVAMFNQPLKVGQLASGTQLTAAARRAADAYKAFLASPAGVSPEVMAKTPEKYKQFNIALLPGTKEELAKAKPAIGLAINDGGVLLLGPRAAIRTRTSLAVYDLRDVIKKLISKNKIKPEPPQADFQAAIVDVLQTSIKPEGDTWGGANDLGKKPAIMIPYNGLLIVFATAETHRTIAGALQDINK